MIRHKHKKGDWLVKDDTTGYVHYRSEMVRKWDGSWVHRRNAETRHPQEFVDAKTDPQALRPVRPRQPLAKGCHPAPVFVGGTDVLPTKTGPGWVKFDLPIGSTGMEVGCTWVVRPSDSAGYRTEE